MKTYSSFLLTSLIFLCFSTLSAQYSSLKLLESGVDQDFEFIEDLNGDGILDAVLQGNLDCGGGSYMHIYHGRMDELSGNYSFDLVHTNFTDQGFFAYLADLNGDGYKEVLHQESGNLNITISRYENDKYVDYVLENTTIDLNLFIDFDNDGIDENIRVQSDDFFRGNFDADFNYSETVFLTRDTESLAVYDYDKDGILDFFYFDDDSLKILLMDGVVKEEFSIPKGQLDYADSDESLFYDADQNGDVDYFFKEGWTNSSGDLYVAWNITQNGFSNVERIARTKSLEDFETFNYIDLNFDGIEELIIKDLSDGDEKFINVKTKEVIDVNEFVDFDTYDHHSTHGDKQLVVASDYKFERESPRAILQCEMINGKLVYRDVPIIRPDYSFVQEAIKTDLNNNGTVDLLFNVDGSSEYGDDNTIRWIEDIDGPNPSLSQQILGYFDYAQKAKFVDIDNDSDIDIVSANNLTVYYNNGSGDFSNRKSFSMGMDPDSKIVYNDLDSDGWVDFVILDRSDNVIFMKNINGVEFESTIIHNQENIRNATLQLLPINNDGNLDIVLTTSQTTFNFINEGNGQFSSRNHTNYFFTFLFYHDIDQDGDVEFFAEDFGDIRYFHFNEAYQLDNSGSQKIFDGPNFQAYQLFDVDKDGDMDFLTTGNSNDDITWHEFITLDSIVNRGRLNEYYDIPDNPYLFRNKYLEEFDQFIIAECDNLYLTQPKEESINICIHADANSNGVLDNEDYKMQYHQFSLESGDIYTNLVTDHTGCVSIGLRSDEYNLNTLSNGCFRFENQLIEIDANLSNIDVLASNSDDQENINVDLSSATTRCGFTVKHWLTIRNESCETRLGTVEIELDEIALWNTIESDQEFFQLEKNLSFDVTDLRPGESKIITWTMQIPDFNFLGDFLNHSIRVMDDGFEEVANQEYKSEIRCAYDPNDKSIEPDRTLEYGESYITDEIISYLIRFQNIGNDTAINIVVRDTLSENIDISSLRNIQSSHNYQFTLDPESRLVEFIFENIKLVDSLTNEIESHGFVKFNVLPKQDLDDYAEIDNSASIYFDFNPPILTNVVSSKYVHDLSILELGTESSSLSDIAISPNPTTDYIEVSELPLRDMSIEIYSNTGSRIYTSSSEATERLIINTSNLSRGVYLIRIYDEKEIVIKKVVVQ